jgi:RNA polymerase sigma-70 factor (ECF subfamily)
VADSLVRGANSFTNVPVFADCAALDIAFTEFYEANFARVYSFARSQVVSSGDANEVVGRIFLKAYSHWGNAPRQEEAVLWLFKIARTTVIDYWRVEGRREAGRVSVDELDDIPDAAINPEAGYALKERAALLLNALSQLDENNRMLLALKFTAQRTNREIAAILRISEAAVSMRLLRALRRMRDELTKLGVS